MHMSLAAPLPPLDTRLEMPLDHLRTIEAESIHIIREIVAEFAHPVLLYSIGKDSSVLLRLAQKAFFPGPVPFPLLHVGTSYKFREMIEFRDRQAAAFGPRLLVHTHTQAIGGGPAPLADGDDKRCGSVKHTAL